MSKTITVDETTWTRSVDDLDASLATFETTDGREVWIDEDGVNFQNVHGVITYAPIEVVEASIAAHRAATTPKPAPAPAAVAVSALPALPNATARLAYSYVDDDGSTTTISTGPYEHGVECLVVDNTDAEQVHYFRLDVVAAVLAARGTH